MQARRTRRRKASPPATTSNASTWSSPRAREAGGAKSQGLLDGGGALDAGAESEPLDFGPPLTRNLPIRFSMLIADWVSTISSPFFRNVGEPPGSMPTYWSPSRSEEHTSELQSPVHIVCRLLL